MIRAFRFIFLTAIGFSQLATPSLAQPRNSSQRGFIQDLLKTYVDSQVRTRPMPADQSAARTATASPELRRAGEMLTAASNEMSQLVNALQSDRFRAQGVRQLLNLAFSVNADAAVLSRQLSYTNDVESLRPSLRKLDQDWRALEYRLGQTQNLSPNTLRHIQRIQQFADQLSAMFKVQPQVDMNALSQRASQMNQALRTLLEDIRYEVSDRNLADSLFSAGRNTYEQLQRFVRLTRPIPGTEVSYDSLKQEFQQLSGDWTTYEQTLRRANNRYVQRQVQRINDDMRSMNDTLYITTGQVNRAELVHTTGILRGDIDRLLRRINLKMLTQLPTSQRFAVEAANDLDQTCNDFAGILNDELENIQDMYLYMFDEWQRLSLALKGVTSQEAQQAIRDVERSLADLQAMLGVRFDFDRDAAMELARRLTGDAQHLQQDIRDTFGRPNRYPRDFQTSCLDMAAQFEAATRQLDDGLTRGDKLQSLAQHTRTLSTTWNALSQMLPRFGAGDVAHLAKLQRDITPQVVKLQTLLTH